MVRSRLSLLLMLCLLARLLVAIERGDPAASPSLALRTEPAIAPVSSASPANQRNEFADSETDKATTAAPSPVINEPDPIAQTTIVVDVSPAPRYGSPPPAHTQRKSVKKAVESVNVAREARPPLRWAIPNIYPPRWRAANIAEQIPRNNGGLDAQVSAANFQLPRIGKEISIAFFQKLRTSAYRYRAGMLSVLGHAKSLAARAWPEHVVASAATDSTVVARNEVKAATAVARLTALTRDWKVNGPLGSYCVYGPRAPVSSLADGELEQPGLGNEVTVFYRLPCDFDRHHGEQRKSLTFSKVYDQGLLPILELWVPGSGKFAPRLWESATEFGGKVSQSIADAFQRTTARTATAPQNDAWKR